jgi:hypothetical protein
LGSGDALRVANEKDVVHQAKTNCLITCHSLEAAKLLTEIRNAYGVMQDTVGAKIVGVGTTHDADDREVLTVSTSNGIDDTETTDGEGDHHCPHSLPSSIPISGIACIDLIAAAAF